MSTKFLHHGDNGVAGAGDFLCDPGVASVAFAESARPYNDMFVAASEFSLGDGAPAVVSLVSRDSGEVSELCSVPYDAVLGTQTVDGTLYGACTDGQTSALCICDDTGYLGSIDLSNVAMANDLIIVEGKVYLTDPDFDITTGTPRGNPQLVCIDLATEEVMIIGLTQFGLLAPNGITQSPEGTLIVPDMASTLWLEFDMEMNLLNTYNVDQAFPDGILFSPRFDGYVVGNVQGAGVFLVDTSFEEVNHVSDVACAAVGISYDEQEIYCPSVSASTITKIPISEECGVFAPQFEEAECEEDEYVNFSASSTSTNTGIIQEVSSTDTSSQTSAVGVEVDSLCENYFTLQECNNVAGCLWVEEYYECESIQLAKARKMSPMGPMPMPDGAGMECDREELGKTGVLSVIPLMMGQQSAAACAQAVRTNQFQCSTTISWSMMRGCACVRIGEICDFGIFSGNNVYSTGTGMSVGMGAGMLMGGGMGMGMRTISYGGDYEDMGMGAHTLMIFSRPLGGYGQNGNEVAAGEEFTGNFKHYKKPNTPTPTQSRNDKRETKPLHGYGELGEMD